MDMKLALQSLIGLLVATMLTASAQEAGTAIVLAGSTTLRASADMTSDLIGVLDFGDPRQVEVIGSEVENGMIQVRISIKGTDGTVTGWIPTENVETYNFGESREVVGRPARNASTAYAESVRNIVLLKDPDVPMSRDNLASESLPPGTRVLLIDTESEPELYQVAVGIGGEITRGWVPRAALSTISLDSPGRAGLDAPADPQTFDQRRPENEYCHNKDVPDSVRILPTIGARLDNRVVLRTVINGETVPCPELPAIPPGPARILEIQESGWVKVRLYSPQLGYIIGWLRREEINLLEHAETEAFCYNCAVSEETRDSELRIQGTPDRLPGQDPGYQSDRYVGLRRADFDIHPWCNDHKSRLRSMPQATFYSLDERIANGHTKKENIIAAGVNAKALANAYDFYQNNRGIIKNSEYMTIVDFSRRSTDRRYHVINMRTGNVRSFFTHHGQGSETNAEREANPGWARRFGNGERDDNGDGVAEPVDNTYLTSLGFAITGFEYRPSDYGRRNGNIPTTRISLHGQTTGPQGNDNMCGRQVIAHGTEDRWFPPNANYYRGQGCPDVPESDWEEVSSAIEGGSVFYQHN
jgi:hypothetical protein